MKKKLLRISVLLMLFGMMGTASAATYTDIYDAPGINGLYMKGSLFGSDDSHSWTFDLKNDGFDPSSETVNNASVSLKFKDDSSHDFFEFARLDLNLGTQIFNWEVDTGTKTFQINSLLTLNATGLLNMTLTAKLGDFYFLGSKLVANAVDSPAAVPVPSALLLMGSGLIGIATATRRKAKA
jgi:hypothetical protein